MVTLGWAGAEVMTAAGRSARGSVMDRWIIGAASVDGRAAAGG
jgi:hypothetical protein